jgi:serine/threonine-protein kinase HipA
MTPLYDMLSMWPYFGKGSNQFSRKGAGLAMAMRSKNVHYALDTIHARHWHKLAMKNGGPAAWDVMLGLVEQVAPALAAVEKRLPKGFPGKCWEAISKGMESQAERFRSELASL